ncbi:hypothetical protein ACFQY0_18770 [Haloferula chungangensis]|uniref:Uncharacterized protein n=1 Tax=Haloferula chungangensis TaxID=1048331 RepID=A0ABW2LD07_9BACT
MEQFIKIMQSEFVWGLLIGFTFAFFAWKSGLSTKLRLSRDVRRLESELRELQGHLNTQLKINSQGNQSLQDELDDLRRQNENLRVSLAGLQNKPGRAEHRQYQITESAVRMMREQAPGFAPAWEKAVRQAEAEVEAGESGLKRLVRKVIPGIGMSSGPNANTPHDDEEH